VTGYESSTVSGAALNTTRQAALQRFREERSSLRDPLAAAAQSSGTMVPIPGTLPRECQISNIQAGSPHFNGPSGLTADPQGLPLAVSPVGLKRHLCLGKSREALNSAHPALLDGYRDALTDEFRSIAAGQLPHHVEASAGHEGSPRGQLQIEVHGACTARRSV
jgi:hypothetical protein